MKSDDGKFTSSPQVNTYQVVIATDGSETYVLFLYRDVQWSRTQSSIGFNAGDGIRGFNLPKTFASFSFFAGISQDYRNIEDTTNANLTGAYYFRVDESVILEPGGTYFRY